MNYGLKHDLWSQIKFLITRARKKNFFYKRLHTARSQTISLFVQNINNLFDGSDFWFVRFSPFLSETTPLLSETTHGLTDAPQLVLLFSLETLHNNMHPSLPQLSNKKISSIAAALNILFTQNFLLSELTDCCILPQSFSICYT